jgi:nicotinate-nucleotide adenylyltransferase
MDRIREGGLRTAFFGGSFDPPHLGHLAIARAARTALALDKVLFAPVGAQPLKPRGSTADFADRVAMTRLAIDGEPGFEVSLLDAPGGSGAPNYTLETLLRLRAESPGAELFCLMGADSFLSLWHWHRGEEIPFAASLIVASRPGEDLNHLAQAWPEGWTLDSKPCATLPPSGEPVSCYAIRTAAGRIAPFYVLPGLHVEISATQIREQIRAAASGLAGGRDVLPASVANYIRSHRLYT